MTHLDSLDWQRTLSAGRLNRFHLLKLAGINPARHVRIRVHRNHGFESVATALRPFLAYAGFQAEFEIGDYDDSLTVRPGDADVEIVWMDFGRYDRAEPEALANWLCQRLAALRQATRAPIIVAEATGTDPTATAVNEALADWAASPTCGTLLLLNNIAAQLEHAFFDERRAALTGTRLSDTACLEAARSLGARLIPGLLGPPVKAVALDLDNTLYDGVLGEDGSAGVVLTDAHRALQQLLVRLSEEGILLVVVSRNEPDDVTALFHDRTDFPLRPEHITDWRVGWCSKAEGIVRSAERLRIAPDSFLLVDDNLGELTDVGRVLPGVKLVFAGHSPEETTAALLYFPALWPLARSATDQLRAADLKANLEREQLAAGITDPREYLGSLGVTLTFALNPVEDLKRLAEISVKTNQFNLALARPSAADVAHYVTDPERCAVMFFLEDRLANSGSVGSLLARREDGVLVVDELCISCRAMGRCLEDIMITAALRRIIGDEPIHTVRFAHAVGPRNKPARNWLAAYASVPSPNSGGALDVKWNSSDAERLLSEAPVILNWRN